MNERRRREGRGRRTLKGRTSRRKEAENSFKEARDEEGSTRREETRGERRRQRYTAHPHLFCTDLSHTHNFIRNPKNANPTCILTLSAILPGLPSALSETAEGYLARQYDDATEVTICEESKKSQRTIRSGATRSLTLLRGSSKLALSGLAEAATWRGQKRLLQIKESYEMKERNLHYKRNAGED